MNSWNSRSQESIFLLENGKRYFVQIILFHRGILIKCLQGQKKKNNYYCSALPDLVKSEEHSWRMKLSHQSKRQFAQELEALFRNDRKERRKSTKLPPKNKQRGGREELDSHFFRAAGDGDHLRDAEYYL